MLVDDVEDAIVDVIEDINIFLLLGNKKEKKRKKKKKNIKEKNKNYIYIYYNKI